MNGAEFKAEMAERRRILRELDIPAFRQRTPGSYISSDETILMAMHKARLITTAGISRDLKAQSRTWLEARGIKTT